LSLETVTLSEQIEKIHAAKNALIERVKKIREFVRSEKFLHDDDHELEMLLGDFQDNITVYVELHTAPWSPASWLELLQKQQGQAPAPPEKEAQPIPLTAYIGETFTLPKAVVCLAGIVGTAVVAQQGLLPPIAVLGVVGATLAFAFAPQLKSAFETLFKKKEGEEEKVIAPERLEEWVNENISRIRQLYVSAKFLIKFQRVPEEIIQRFRELGLDPAVVDREKYFRETLPPLFLDWLGQIMVQCDKSLWQRSQVLISAMVQASQAQMMMRGAG
jgi:hypothetical protein